jgi:hypothetical protein
MREEEGNLCMSGEMVLGGLTIIAPPPIPELTCVFPLFFPIMFLPECPLLLQTSWHWREGRPSKAPSPSSS